MLTDGPALPGAGALPGVGAAEVLADLMGRVAAPILSEDGLDCDTLEVEGVPREGRAVELSAAVVLRALSGLERSVDKLMMSLPWTTRLSFDFLRSLVSISVYKFSWFV